MVTSTLNCSPERLMQLVRAGDAQALEHITRCYSERLLEAGRRHCRTSSEAEDAVQDALVLASRHLVDLRDDSRLEGWLVKVVASACRRLGRGRKNDSNLHDADTALGAGQDDPEAEAERRELGARLEQQLLALAPDDRSIVLLAELEGFSAAEIGRELNLSEGAVRTRLSRLRQRLAKALTEQNDARL